MNDKEYTLNDFIKELESLAPEYKELPVTTFHPNGIEAKPKCYRMPEDPMNIFGKTKKMVISPEKTY